MTASLDRRMTFVVVEKSFSVGMAWHLHCSISIIEHVFDGGIL